MQLDTPNTFIKPSPIHGLGLFAERDILRGEYIIHGPANYLQYLEEWVQYKNNTKTPSYNFNLGYCMLNHSETPNTYRNGAFKIVALRDISLRTEITEDYNALPDQHNPFKTVCMEKVLYETGVLKKGIFI